jgi:type III restriction enzyme
MGDLLVDLDVLEAVAAALDLREPNKAAVESIAYEVAQHFDIDERPAPFVGVVDAATGVGKTWIFAGALEYLAKARGVRNVALIAPSRVILNKTVDQFTMGHAKSLLLSMDAPITLVTATNFDSPAIAAAMDDDTRVKLYVFTVQSLLRPKSKRDRRTHSFQEGLGGGFYARLQQCEDLTVFADEHHSYFGPEFGAAIDDLSPWTLIGLTATPHKRTPPEQIIFRYPLAAAIAERFVKTPVIVGRRDDKHDAVTKLLDGVTLLEYKRTLATRYASAQGVSPINPIMLVVARDIDEAEEWAGIIRDENFQQGKYRDAVLVVHSRTIREDQEERELARLVAVERPDSPVRVVVSVAMLKEGWDVKNVYVLVSTQPSLSEVLTEQVLGRGLRLPWNEYTGVEMLDTLEVLAHERFEELLRKRKVLSESFIDHRTRAVLRLNSNGQQIVVREITEVETDVLALGDVAVDTDRTSSKEIPLVPEGRPVVADVGTREGLGSEEVNRLSQLIQPALPLHIPVVTATPIISNFSLTDITEFEQFRRLGQRLRVDPEDTLRRTKVGARVVADLFGGRRVELVTSTGTDQVRATGLTFSEQDLKAQLTEAILGAPIMASRPDRGGRERHAVQPILDAFFDGLDGGADALLSAYLERATAQLLSLVASEARRFAEKPRYDETVRMIEFAPTRTTARPTTLNRHGTFDRRLAYEGWSDRAVFSVEWFDSAPERDLANIMDEAEPIQRWARLHRDELPIVWAADGRRYNPDFIAIEGDRKFVVEVKSDRDLASEEVGAKREAARRWTNVVNAAQVDHAPWLYLLLSETNIKRSTGSWEALKAMAS